MEKEIIILPSEMTGNGMSGNGMTGNGLSGNGMEFDENMIVSETEFEELVKDFV